MTRILLTLLSVSVVIFIFSQSMMPATDSSAESGRVVAFLNSICTSLGFEGVFTQGFVRTCAHLVEFAVLGLLLFFTVSSYTYNLKFKLIITPALYISTAIIDESIQLTSPGRTFQFKDLFIDSIGGTLGLLVALIIMHFAIKVFKKRG